MRAARFRQARRPSRPATCSPPASSTCRSMAAAASCSTTIPMSQGIETICRAHAPFGTTALLPTLITDTPEVTAAAVAAGIEAARRKVPGFAGLHLEGPHLSHRPQGRARSEADPADDRCRSGGADCGAQGTAGAAHHRRAGIGHARSRSRRSRRPASSSASAIPTRPTPPRAPMPRPAPRWSRISSTR